MARITEGSSPAFATICLNGSSIAFLSILIPISWSELSAFNLSVAVLALNKAVPPPGTTPSSTAALVACNASSTLAFFSFISTSVAAPTFITATPPANLAILS